MHVMATELHGHTRSDRVDHEDREVRRSVQAHHLLFRCVGCSSSTYFLAELYEPGAVDIAKGESVKVKGEIRIRHQYPVSTATSSDAVPQRVRDAAIEAESCLSVGAWNATGTMTRRSLDAMVADKGGEGGDLYGRLKDLKQKHVLTPDLWEWAEELRVVGRHGAHPEWEEVTQEDAEYAVRFLREILRYLYINPAERAAKRLKETKGKAERSS
jgi:hypothetical protein